MRRRRGKMAELYVKKEMAGYMKKTLERMEKEFKQYPEEYIKFEADIDPEMIDILLEDALCEEQRGDSMIPVYSYRVISNPELLEEYRARNNGMKAFHVLKRDRKRAIAEDLI